MPRKNYKCPRKRQTLVQTSKAFYFDFSSWSLSTVPPCASICSQPLPAASTISDLFLTAVIPARNTSARLDVATMNKTENYLYTGDKLLYKCKTDYWGVFGGVDTEYRGFGCTEDGVINTPNGNDIAWIKRCAQAIL